jgi:hypothetical protein
VHSLQWDIASAYSHINFFILELSRDIASAYGHINFFYFRIK